MKKDFAKYAILGLLVAGVAAFTAPTALAANFAPADVTVTVADAIAVTKNSGGDMDWGLLAAPGTATGNTVFTISTSGLVTFKSGSTSGKVLDSAGSEAKFTVGGEPNQSVNLTLASVDPDATNAKLSALESNKGTSSVALGAGGSFEVIVTADLTLTPAAAGGGPFTGSITVTANY